MDIVGEVLLALIFEIQVNKNEMKCKRDFIECLFLKVQIQQYERISPERYLYLRVKFKLVNSIYYNRFVRCFCVFHDII